MAAGAPINVLSPSENHVEIGVVWNSLPNELREVARLASMVGALSILSVVVGAGLALMIAGVS
jgi:hypothetical protein